MKCFSLVGVAALMSVACGGHSYRGCALYQEGRYIEAAETFERTEHRLHLASAGEQAEYALYRGLTFLRLGDLSSARDWLAYASRVERQKPGTLDVQERKLLNAAWGELDERVQPAPAPQEQLVSVATDAEARGPSVVRANGQRSIGPAEPAVRR